MDPFTIMGLSIILTAKCLEFLAPLRLFLINIIGNKCKIAQQVLFAEPLEPKNWKQLQNDLRSIMVAWLHAEQNDHDQLHIACTQLHNSSEISKANIPVIIQHIEKYQANSKYHAARMLGVCQKSLVLTAWKKWLQRIVVFIIACIVAYIVCKILNVRLLNSMGIYTFSSHPNMDRLVTAIFIALGTYFWNAAIFLLAKAKERANIRRKVLA